MQVKLGWATEYGRQKYDVTVEEDDFRQQLVEAQIPEDLVDGVSVPEKFKIMDAMAQRLVTFSLLEYGELLPDQARDKLAQQTAVLNERLAKVKERLGVA